MSSVKNKKIKVALGLSGGVDSSVAAYLLQKKGYEVVGVFMQCWESKADGCASNEDKSYAVVTAAKLGIKFQHLDFISEYKSRVIEYFYKEYKEGRTPNPDVMCNKEIKFGIFFDWAMKNGFDYVATGHYAQVKKDKKGSFHLLKGKDSKKDQSYFLYLLGQKQLTKTQFPIGRLTKQAVRDIAKNADLPTAKRAESMGICFIGEVDIKDFLKKQIKEKTGEVHDLSGNVIGSHEGVWYYTIGQRHGFKVTKYFGEPLYVVSKDAKKNILIVGKEPQVYSKEFDVKGIHWIEEKKVPEGASFACGVRIRHLGTIYPAKVLVGKKSTAHVTLKDGVFAVAPGQSAVFYKSSDVLGGGIIV